MNSFFSFLKIGAKSLLFFMIDNTNFISLLLMPATNDQQSFLILAYYNTAWIILGNCTQNISTINYLVGSFDSSSSRLVVVSTTESSTLFSSLCSCSLSCFLWLLSASFYAFYYYLQQSSSYCHTEKSSSKNTKKLSSHTNASNMPLSSGCYFLVKNVNNFSIISLSNSTLLEPVLLNSSKN